MEQKKFVLMGCGFLGGIVAQAYADGLLPGYQLAGAASRHWQAAQNIAHLTGCRACQNLQELLALEPDCLVETASVQCVRDIALPALAAGVDLVVLSIGAFADPAFLEQVRQASERHGARVHLASGAIGGVDILQALALMAQAQGIRAKVAVHTRKNADSLLQTSLADSVLHSRENASSFEVFSGSAGQAIQALPANMNVAVAAALAATGPSRTPVHIAAQKDFVGDEHHISAQAGEVEADLRVYSSTSAVAGWSVVALLRNLSSPIAFF